MNSSSKRRFRPRFSVRLLLVLLTPLCAYLACWEPTKATGVRDVFDFIIPGAAEEFSSAETTSDFCVAPLLVAVNEFEGASPLYRRRYYFWFFGYVAKLPFERALPIEDVVD